MNTLTACVMNETQKLISKKKTIALLIITAIIPLLTAVGAGNFEKRLGIIAVSSTDFPVMVLGIFTGILLPLFICMTAADIFSGELGDRTLKAVFLRPVTRFKVFISKLGSLGIYIAASLAMVFSLSVISGLFLSGGEKLAQGFLKSIVAYSTAVVPMLLIAIASAFVAQFFKSSSGTLTICILLFIALKVIAVIFPNVSPALITSYTDWHLLWNAGTVPAGKIFNVFMFMVSYSIIFLASGFYLFDRKEL